MAKKETQVNPPVRPEELSEASLLFAPPPVWLPKAVSYLGEVIDYVGTQGPAKKKKESAVFDALATVPEYREEADAYVQELRDTFYSDDDDSLKKNPLYAPAYVEALTVLLEELRDIAEAGVAQASNSAEVPTSSLEELKAEGVDLYQKVRTTLEGFAAAATLKSGADVRAFLKEHDFTSEVDANSKTGKVNFTFDGVEIPHRQPFNKKRATKKAKGSDVKSESKHLVWTINDEELPRTTSFKEVAARLTTPEEKFSTSDVSKVADMFTRTGKKSHTASINGYKVRMQLK